MPRETPKTASRTPRRAWRGSSTSPLGPLTTQTLAPSLRQWRLLTAILQKRRAARRPRRRGPAKTCTR
eukprot:11170139-Lingulodinium_polyedra.AAC.1